VDKAWWPVGDLLWIEKTLRRAKKLAKNGLHVHFMVEIFF